MDQKPSIGRIVHYQGPGTNQVVGSGNVPPKVYPATIVTVHSDTCVDLFVMTHIGHMSLTSISFSPEYKAGFWSWPPRV